MNYSYVIVANAAEPTWSRELEQGDMDEFLRLASEGERLALSVSSRELLDASKIVLELGRRGVREMCMVYGGGWPGLVFEDPIDDACGWRLRIVRASR